MEVSLRLCLRNRQDLGVLVEIILRIIRLRRPLVLHVLNRRAVVQILVEILKHRQRPVMCKTLVILKTGILRIKIVSELVMLTVNRSACLNVVKQRVVHQHSEGLIVAAGAKFS